MRDFGGFIILTLVLFFALYLTVRFVVPFFLLYCGSILVFFLVAGRLMKKGRRHASHLDSFLKPGYVTSICLLALLLPSIHAAIVGGSGVSDHWAFIWAGNAIPVTAWTVRLLWRHVRQGKRFISEGHDIEELIDEAGTRAGILDLKIEIMAAAADMEGEPEPWELEAGLVGDNGQGLSEHIRRLILDMKQLRDAYLTLGNDLSGSLAVVKQSGRRSLPPNAQPDLDRVSELNGLWNGISREAAAVLSEKTGYAPYGWDAA